MSDNARRAREPRAGADRVRAAAAAGAAGRSVRRQFLAMGAATSLAVLGTGLLSRWGDEGLVWPRALVVGVLWAGVFGGAFALVGAQAMHAAPARFRAIVVAVAGGIVTGLALAAGAEFAVGYPLGAAAVMAVWVLGAAWAAPRA
jgi:hypothetical protein